MMVMDDGRIQNEDMLKSICEKNNVSYEIIYELLQFEKDRKLLHKKVRIQEKIDDVINKGF